MSTVYPKYRVKFGVLFQIYATFYLYENSSFMKKSANIFCTLSNWSKSLICSYQIKYRTRAIKGRGFYSKNIFWTHALWCVWPKFAQAHVVKIDKIHLNARFFGRLKGCSYNSRATFNGADTAIQIYIIYKMMNWFQMEFTKALLS